MTSGLCYLIITSFWLTMLQKSESTLSCKMRRNSLRGTYVGFGSMFYYCRLYIYGVWLNDTRIQRFPLTGNPEPVIIQLN